MWARKNKLDVWTHFEKLSSTKVKHKLCSKELSVSGDVGSSMHGHMHSKHPSVFEQSHANSTPTAFLKQCSCPDSRADKMTVALAEVIIDNMLPVSIVESDSLRRLLELLEPQYKVPCRQTMNTEQSIVWHESKHVRTASWQTGQRCMLYCVNHRHMNQLIEWGILKLCASSLKVSGDSGHLRAVRMSILCHRLPD